MTALISIAPPPPTVPLIESITIRIPIDEVFALTAVLANVSGPPNRSRRGLCDQVLRCLQDATQSMKSPNHSDIKGSLRFSQKEIEG